MGARTTRSGEGGRPPRIKGIRVEGLLSDKGPRARDTPDPRATSAPTSRTISVRTAVTIGCVTRACTPLRVQMTTLVRRSRRPQGWKLRTGIVKCTPGSCCEHEGHRRKREGREYAPRSCTAGARPGRCQPTVTSAEAAGLRRPGSQSGKYEPVRSLGTATSIGRPGCRGPGGGSRPAEPGALAWPRLRTAHSVSLDAQQHIDHCLQRRAHEVQPGPPQGLAQSGSRDRQYEKWSS